MPPLVTLSLFTLCWRMIFLLTVSLAIRLSALVPSLLALSLLVASLIALSLIAVP
ncbi:MAG: hypothetical protein ACM3ZO_12095 [Clostridia bacterium]